MTAWAMRSAIRCWLRSVSGCVHSIPPGAICGRLGGDEFVVAMNAENAEAAMKDMSGLARCPGRPAWVSDRAVQIGVSAGLVEVAAAWQTRDDLIRRANFALRVAKSRDAEPSHRFRSEHGLGIHRPPRLERELKRALAGEDLQVHYQPIVASDGSRIVGVEALARWTHPQHGAIGPLVFIPVAEQAGMMDALGEYVLRRALSDAKRWPDLYVSVNVSPVQVRDRKFVETVARACCMRKRFRRRGSCWK